MGKLFFKLRFNIIFVIIGFSLVLIYLLSVINIGLNNGDSLLLGLRILKLFLFPLPVVIGIFLSILYYWKHKDKVNLVTLITMVIMTVLYIFSLVLLLCFASQILSQF